MSHTSPARSPLVSLFIGAEGLRYGWRFLLFALGIEVVESFVESPVIGYLARRLGIALDELSAPALAVGELVSFGGVLLITGLAALFERRRIDSYGLPVSQAFRLYFWKGMLAGFLVIV